MPSFFFAKLSTLVRSSARIPNGKCIDLLTRGRLFGRVVALLILDFLNGYKDYGRPLMLCHDGAEENVLHRPCFPPITRLVSNVIHYRYTSTVAMDSKAICVVVVVSLIRTRLLTVRPRENQTRNSIYDFTSVAYLCDALRLV